MGASALCLRGERRGRAREDAVRPVLREALVAAVRVADCTRNHQARRAEARREMTRMVNAMTVDVEDYFHASAFDRVVSRSSWATRESRVVKNTETLLEGFDRAGVHATFFILGWVAERFPRLVRDIADRGHEIASHGFHHQLIYLLPPDQFREDVRRAQAPMREAAGWTVRGYRAPRFPIVRVSLWAVEVLIEEGHSYDASIFPIRHDRYGIADAPRHAHRNDTGAGSIVEVPSSTV